MKTKILFWGILLLANYSHGIVLHNSVDIANEILLLKQEMAAIKQENIQLKASMKGKWGEFEETIIQKKCC